MSEKSFTNVNVFVSVYSRTLIAIFTPAAAWEKSALTTHTAAPNPMSGEIPA